MVRLNEADTYDAAVLERAGIAHHDLFFPDCTTPPDDVVERFLDICDGAAGAVAVHCRAGLGRTGTLIGVWLMRHAGFRADEAIGWMRTVRPGCVIGPQQAYLKACEGRRWRGNALLPAEAAPPASAGLCASPERSSDEAAAAAVTAAAASKQVTAGMCARGRAKAKATACRLGRPACAGVHAGRWVRAGAVNATGS